MADGEEIPWKRLFLEATAIVASILLAFAIDAWWDDRQIRQFEQETLRGLQAEYEDHKQMVAQQKESHVMFLRAIAGLIAACHSGTYESSEFSIGDAIIYLQIPVTSDLGTGVRDALISAGRIEVLADKQLRYQLAAWDSVIDEVTDGQYFSRDIVLEIVLPYLVRLNAPLSRGIDQTWMPWPVPAESMSGNTSATFEFLTDPEFCSILDVRFLHMSHTTDEMDTLIVAIDEILARIDLSLDE